jgi:hypothetical protein
MKCNALYIISFVSVQSFHLHGEYSEFSGLVSIIGLGREQQRLRVNLDFDLDISWVFMESDCPPFAGDCFIVPTQGNLYPAHLSFVKIPLSLVPEYYTTVDSSIGGRMYSDLRLFLMRRTSLEDLRYSEVMGSIGLARGTAIVFNRRIRLRHDESGVFISDFEPSVSDSCGITVPSSSSGWEIEARFKLASTESDMLRVRIDPSSHDILLPKTTSSTLLGDFQTPIGNLLFRDDTLHVECGSDGRVDPSLGIWIHFLTSDKLFIPYQEALYAGHVSSASDPLCPVRLRLVDQPHAVIGRPLLRALDSIVFNYIAGSITFIPHREKTRMQPIFPPTTFIPIFSKPVVFPNQILISRRTSDDAIGYVLANKRPLRMPGILGTTVWTFVKHPGHVLTEETNIEHTLIPGIFSEATLQYADNALSIDLTPALANGAPALQILLLEFSNKLEIRIMERSPEDFLSPIETLGLPTPTTVNNGSECCICINPLLTEEPVQGMRHCPHSFHFRCIKLWLETRSRTCPCCRSRV